MNLSDLVTSSRAAKEMSRDQLAKAAGTTRQAIFEIETGKNWNLKITAIDGLSKGLRVRPNRIVEAALQSKREANGGD